MEQLTSRKIKKYDLFAIQFGHQLVIVPRLVLNNIMMNILLMQMEIRGNIPNLRAVYLDSPQEESQKVWELA